MNQHHFSLDTARVGIDIGRVIMAPTDADGRADTSFLNGTESDAMRTPPNEGAFDVIREIVFRTHGNVWLVSKAGRRIQELTRRWLHHWDFYRATGMVESHLRFCIERRDKATHAKELGLTHFVDDRVDVLQHLRGLVPALYLFGHQRPGAAVPSDLIRVLMWSDVRAELLDAPGPEDECQVASMSGNTM